MPDIEHKSVTVELKAGGVEGEFTARVATLEVMDLDGDVTMKGAFPAGKEVLVSAYQHGSWQGALPVGVATIREKDKDVIAEGRFNLKTTGGRDTYETVKFTPKQEYSYGFIVLAQADEKEVEAWAKAHDGARPNRIIKSVDPFEISPVLKGAGIATATLDIKSGQSYADEADAALAAVNAWLTRTKSLADLRRKDGRDLSEPNRKRIESLVESMTTLQADIKALLAEPRDEDREKAQRLFLEFSRINAQIQSEVA
jgi:hypothetical protein